MREMQSLKVFAQGFIAKSQNKTPNIVITLSESSPQTADIAGISTPFYLCLQWPHSITKTLMGADFG